MGRSASPAAATIPEPKSASALAAYEALAPWYDRFTHDCAHDRWLAGIEEWAIAAGLRGRRLLDVACGTGKSFEPMLDRGYEVTACDVSPAMVAQASRRARGAATVVVADMRRLPWRSRFDLITCIDDAVNYLLTEDDLLATLGGMAAALRPGGILVFDTNSLATYRSAFAEDFEVRDGRSRFRWRGLGSADLQPGSLAEATIEDVGEDAPDSRHVQRHWPVATLRRACSRAGFSRISFRGQMTGCRLVGDPDEERHTKVVCLAAKRRPRRGGGP